MDGEWKVSTYWNGEITNDKEQNYRRPSSLIGWPTAISPKLIKKITKRYFGSNQMSFKIFSRISGYENSFPGISSGTKGL